MFLLVLIGTTLEALTARSREEFRIRRWRSRVRQHVIVCGYGTKGRSAIRSLQANGTPLDKIVVVDPEPRAIDEANSLGPDRHRRRRRPHRGAAPGLGRARPRGHRRGQPGRRRRPHHADRAAAQPERADHDQRPRGGERQPAAPVRRRHRHHHVGDVRPAARPVDRRPARGRRRRGPRHRRPGPRPAPAHGDLQRGRASTRARCATSSCRSPAAAARCASTTR